MLVRKVKRWLTVLLLAFGFGFGFEGKGGGWGCYFRILCYFVLFLRWVVLGVV